MNKTLPASDVTAADRAAPRVRLDSIDALRGIVMVLMALDHTRDFFTNVAHDPLDLAQTSPALFLTRWITHFCAPVFVFLAGTSAYFVSQRLSRPALAKFLWTRGLWLIFLEYTVVFFAWDFSPPWSGTPYLQVIWAIGWSMIALAVLVALPVAAVGAIGIALMAAHNLFDGIAPEQFGAWAPLWRVLHVPGPTPVGDVYYPLVPWIGVMAAGYAFGALYTLDAAHRQRWLLALGSGAVMLFVALRLPNAYGDAALWTAQPDAIRTLLSVLHTTKYPPSLLYLLMTLGPACLALIWLERPLGRAGRWLVDIGRVPLLFYVAHIVLAHFLAAVVAWQLGFGTDIFTSYPAVPGWGFGLPVVYAAWVVVVVLLYPVCRWFAEVKRTRRDWWLSYL